MYKSLQVLRTAVAVQSLAGDTVPAGTRVVVVRSVKPIRGEELITARVQDPNFPELTKARVSLSASQVATTKRGRPTKAEA
jgi:hypothetical protein